ncbi:MULTISPECIES: DUF1788 domain-containing protein [Vibrio]|uniref:DUF1788 domain-containing protein n=1 Tax=Vibrio TaxID=662 RepID=UPI000B59E938|nr:MULTISPECIES: DUF1788 domain-containing protein [Vibrio]ASI96782.1 hypothetical protein BSZ04_17750 [Vibrio rotiferianus]NAZ69810.1 DUF1788 domain-containing protein [Vibrio toranzoniae]
MSGKFNSVLTKVNLSDAYTHLTDVLSSDPFIKMEGLNGDIPFHICPFEPSLQSEINVLVKQVKNYLRDAQVKVLEVNLYDLVIDISRQEGDWEWLLENETTMSKDELKEELQGIIDTKTVLIPAIVEKMAESDFDILMITGVGEVFPYIRSSSLLENLQIKAKDKPTLLFFPGKYKHSLEKGSSLILFGTLEDDKYYRAFNILDRAS